MDFTPEWKAKAVELAKHYVLGPIYTPATLKSEDKKGTLMLPGLWGAGNWNTGAFDPETAMYYAVSMTLHGVRGVSSTKDNAEATMDYAGAPGGARPGAPGGIPGLGRKIQRLPRTQAQH